MAYLMQNYIWVLSLQKSLKNYVRILMIKFLKFFYINIITLLYNLAKSWLYKYITNLSTISMLSIKIIVFEIANAKLMEIIKKSSFLKPDFLVWVTKYIIFDLSNNFLYNQIRDRSYNNLQIYFNTFGIIIANSVNIRT